MNPGGGFLRASTGTRDGLHTAERERDRPRLPAEYFAHPVASSWM